MSIAQVEPHGADRRVREVVTGDNGEARFDAVVESHEACYLLPHGVPAYSHHACVDHPDLGAINVGMPSGEPWLGRFDTEARGGSCDDEL